MSKIEKFSRILLKRTDIPTLSATTAPDLGGFNDHTLLPQWLDTDIYEGELFLNSVDEKLWIRCSTKIRRILMDGDVTGGGTGTSGTSGTSGIDGSSGTSGVSELIITNISSEYTGTTADQYIRCSGATYTIQLPIATGSGKILYIKNISNLGIISIDTGIGFLDDNVIYYLLEYLQTIVIIDASPNHWEVLNLFTPVI